MSEQKTVRFNLAEGEPDTIESGSFLVLCSGPAGKEYYTVPVKTYLDELVEQQQLRILALRKRLSTAVEALAEAKEAGARDVAAQRVATDKAVERAEDAGRRADLADARLTAFATSLSNAKREMEALENRLERKAELAERGWERRFTEVEEKVDHARESMTLSSNQVNNEIVNLRSALERISRRAKDDQRMIAELRNDIDMIAVGKRRGADE